MCKITRYFSTKTVSKRCLRKWFSNHLSKLLPCNLEFAQPCITSASNFILLQLADFNFQQIYLELNSFIVMKFSWFYLVLIIKMLAPGSYSWVERKDFIFLEWVICNIVTQRCINLIFIIRKFILLLQCSWNNVK